MASLADRSRSDDPRLLRVQLDRAAALAYEHALTSVVVGLAGAPGDLLFPEFVDFLESELRVDDAIVRMTRERAVLFLADVQRPRAQEIMQRVVSEFAARFSPRDPLAVGLGYYEIAPGAEQPTLKGVLPELFLEQEGARPEPEAV